MREWTKALVSLAVIYTLVVLPGCNSGFGDTPETGTVTGTVTLDGKPLADADIVFHPKSKGRSSAGKTDASGKYELQYNGEIMGAKIDKHTVRITTFQEFEGDPDAEGVEVKPKREEEVPEKYNSKTTLEKEVKAGENVIDFDLKS